MNDSDWAGKLRDFFWDDPLTACAVTAALVALATTPVAFAVLARRDWFKARRGRVMQKPEFASVVCAMMLVMGIPAIFAALVVKSRHFDKNRYEFDPNKTWSVLEQGRGYKSLEDADNAIKTEMGRLALERKNLVESVKKLDEAMLLMRAAASRGTSPEVSQAIPGVLQRLAAVRKSVGVDGPQQLMDFTAPPVEIAAIQPAVPISGAVASAAVATPTQPSATPAATPPAQTGLTKSLVDGELAEVPTPQKSLAAMLPLIDLPSNWEVGKSGEKHIETFNAENLFEKIDGRAESFLDYKVKGMAYTYYRPIGDSSNEVQLYIFELGDNLKALGKYASEKPEEAKLLPVGSEGYTAAGSLLFYSGPYYTQIVSTKDDATFSAFALEVAKRIAAAQKPGGVAAESAGAKPGETGSAPASGTPESLFALLPAKPAKSSPTYVPADVFGYAFFTDVFLAEYTEGKASWKGFVRPYASPEEAKAVLTKFLASVKQDGAEAKEIKAEGADRMVLVSNIGLTDILFIKGNTLAGAAGATDPAPAEGFSRAFAKSLPPQVQGIPVSSPKEKEAADNPEGAENKEK
jgi:hypothetical protein